MPVAQPTLQAKVDALRQPACYAGNPAVEAIETHMSWVFLAGADVYKLKKPVRHGQLDFSSLLARHFYCLEEVRLNQPLAGAVYLEVVPLLADSAGSLRLRGAGAIVEWLVRMRRLPAAMLLDRMLEQGRAGPDHLRWVALQLGRFYRGLEPAPLGPGHYRARLAGVIDECEAGLCAPGCGLDLAACRALCAGLRAVLLGRPGLFDARVDAGRIVEGHGDLRPEHIFLGEPPAVIDRLEFSVDLRTLDTLDEMGFLALECERFGAPALGRVLLDAYRECADDDGADLVLHFYQALRACIRARLAIGHLLEPQYRELPKWPARARLYLQLAAAHLHPCQPGVSLPPAAP